MNPLAYAQATDGVITVFSSEHIFLWTRTNQAFFSSRRALLIREVLKWPLFRFASLLDGPGWRSLGQWLGHLSIFPMLARRAGDYLGGSCLLLRARLAIGTFRYVDDDRVACADTSHRLSWREKGIARHLDSAAEAVLEPSLVSLVCPSKHGTERISTPLALLLRFLSHSRSNLLLHHGYSVFGHS